MVDAYLTDTVTLLRATRGAWSEPGATTFTSIPAHIRWQQKRVLNTAGAEVLAAGYVLTKEEVLPTDKLIIADKHYGVLAVEPQRDFGTSHYKVWVA